MLSFSDRLVNLANCTDDQWIKNDLTTTMERGKGLIGKIRRFVNCVINYIHVQWLKKPDEYACYRADKVITAVENLFSQNQDTFRKTDPKAENNLQLLQTALTNFDKLTHETHHSRIEAIYKQALEIFKIKPAPPTTNQKAEIKADVKPKEEVKQSSQTKIT